MTPSTKFELRNIQFTCLKLGAITKRLFRIHFKEKCQKIGLHFDDLKSIHDLSKFPFTTKEDFRSNYPFDMFAVPLNEIHRIHASSGTTGKSTIVGYTKNDLDTWSQLTCRSLKYRDPKAADKVLYRAVSTGMTKFSQETDFKIMMPVAMTQTWLLLE